MFMNEKPEARDLAQGKNVCLASPRVQSLALGEKKERKTGLKHAGYSLSCCLVCDMYSEIHIGHSLYVLNIY